MSKISLLSRAVQKRNPLRTLVHIQRADETHDTLLDKFHIQIDQALLEDAKLVKDREEMLRRMPKGARVCEIGVATGSFSKTILDLTKPEQLYLVDPWNFDADDRYSEPSFNQLKTDLATEIADGRVVIKRGFSDDVLPRFKQDFFDWVYIDAAHDYDSVRRDLENCARIVKHGGLIAGHDYVRWVSPTSRYGVLEAVNEFVDRTKSKFVFLTNQFDKHDSFTIQLNKS